MSQLQIHTQTHKFEIAKNLYGIFFEDINRAGDGGLYPEMLRNRAFEDSLLPEGYSKKEDGVHVVTDSGWEDEFNGGEGLSRWISANRTRKTDVPAWYAEHAKMRLELTDTLNENRAAALEVTFEEGGFIYNTGFEGIAMEEGETYPFYMFAKAKKPLELEIYVEEESACTAVCRIPVKGEGYLRYDVPFKALASCQRGRLVIRSREEGELLLGFTSLMPGKTYHGHGLRVDLAEKLKELHPRFLRFPGGCIVEGTTASTVMLFRNTVGPVWERPGQQLVWHYRSTNGLGFHEYLQLCEDLQMEPLYVCNCGMTCQARKCVLFSGEELEEILQDTLDAIEYAIGPADSKWGKRRAQMGHPEPFGLTFLEIGNENWGPAYEERYRRFYREIKQRYPQIKTIANAHVEEHGLSAECVDEHFYSTMEFFAENLHHYDQYDRKGPKIFVGEQAVNEGAYRGRLYGALGEAAFLIGLEQNQDIVALASYAPLFENIHYSSWSPNLIRFDNRTSLGIPTYYVWKMFGANRGSYVLESEEKTGKVYRPFQGMACLKAKGELRFRNSVWNGETAAVTQEMMGYVEAEADGFCLKQPDETQKKALKERMPWADQEKSFIVFGEEDQTFGRFETEILVEENYCFELGMFGARAILSYYDQLLEGTEKIWSPFGVRPLLWKIRDGKCFLAETAFPEEKQLTEEFPVEISPGAYHCFGYETDGEKARLYVDGVMVKEAELPGSASFASVATEDEDAVIVKMVNLKDETDPVRITLDCAVEDRFMVTLLTGDRNAQNSFEEPECVRDEVIWMQGASQSFVYHAPAWSVSVLRLVKTKTA